MAEAWRSIPGYEGIYEVSDLGRIKTFALKGAGRLRKFYANKKGHVRIDLHKNKRRERKYVHRIVLETFVGHCPDGMEGCHNDSNPGNNKLGNLRWDTPKGNASDKEARGTVIRRDRHKLAKISSAQATEIVGLLDKGLTQNKVAEMYGICQGSVSYILRTTAK